MLFGFGFGVVLFDSMSWYVDLVRVYECIDENAMKNKIPSMLMRFFPLFIRI